MILLGLGPLIPKREKTQEEISLEYAKKKELDKPRKRKAFKIYSSLKEKLDEFIIKPSPEECWHQDSSSHKDMLQTYTTINWKNKRYSTRLLVYGEFVGKLPEGKQINTTCQNKGCLNPAHFTLVDHLNPEIDTPLKRALALINEQPTKEGCWRLRNRSLKEAATIDFRDKNHIPGTRGVIHLARPLLYEHFIGSIPHDKWVKTSCGQGGCVNPEHMFLADTKMAPLKKDGVRSDCRLSYQEVQEIKRMLAKGIKRSIIGNKFGVSWSLIYRIDKELLYTHVTID